MKTFRSLSFIALLVIFLILAIYRIRYASPHSDEYSSILALKGLSTPELIQLLDQAESVKNFHEKMFSLEDKPSAVAIAKHLKTEEPQSSPLYYFASLPIVALGVGDPLVAARMSSLLFALLFGLVLFRFLRANDYAPFDCSKLVFLSLFSPPLFLFFTEARFYSAWSVFIFLGFLSYFYLVGFFKAGLSFGFSKSNKTEWLLFTLLNGAALNFQPLHIFVMMAQGLGVLIYYRKLWSRFIVSSLGSAFMLSPWLISFLTDPNRNRNVGHVSSRTDYYFWGQLRALSRSFFDNGASRLSEGWPFYFQIAISSLLILFFIYLISRANLKRNFLLLFGAPMLVLFTDMLMGTSFSNIQRYMASLSVAVPLSFILLTYTQNSTQNKTLFPFGYSFSFFALAFFASCLLMAQSLVWRTAPYGLEMLADAKKIRIEDGAYSERLPESFIPAIVFAARLEVFYRAGLGELRLNLNDGR